MSTTTSSTVRRSGPETRAAIQQVATDLFTTKGYEVTTMREIADVLGIKKASLYYHFAGKDELLRSLFEQRGNEARDLLEWVAGQPQEPGLIETTVLRWVDSFSGDKLRGIRFMSANPLLARSTAASAGDRIGSTLSAIVDALAPLLPNHTPVAELQLRMALLSINAAVNAAAGTDFTDDQIIAAARQHALTVLAAQLS
jgi:AcrR family transcriptional regulator